MQLQEFPSSCGAAALANALESIGTRITQKAAGKLARTDHEGTDESGIKRAIRDLGFKAVEIAIGGEHGKVALASLIGTMLLGHPVLLVVDNDTHWIAAVGLRGSSIVIVDSADGGLMSVLDHVELLSRWRGGTKKAPHFYGVAIWR